MMPGRWKLLAMRTPNSHKLGVGFERNEGGRPWWRLYLVWWELRAQASWSKDAPAAPALSNISTHVPVEQLDAKGNLYMRCGRCAVDMELAGASPCYRAHWWQLRRKRNPYNHPWRRLARLLFLWGAINGPWRTWWRRRFRP